MSSKDAQVVLQGIVLELRDLTDSPEFQELDEETRDRIEDLEFRAEEIEQDCFSHSAEAKP